MNKDSHMIEFGKYLINYLKIPIVEEEVDWDALMRDYKYNHYDGVKNKPGLMFLNWIVCTFMGINPENVRFSVHGRRTDERLARQIVFYIATEIYDYIYTDVAEFFYNKRGKNMKHSTVLHGKNVIKSEMETNDLLKRTIEDIIYNLKGYEYITYKDINKRTSTDGSFENIPELETKE